MCSQLGTLLLWASSFLLEDIKQAAQMMVTGNIVNYRFDEVRQAIIER
jgi:hypothetical protein